MSRLLEYRISAKLAAEDVPFYALIMAAMRRADSINLKKLQAAWPGIWEELQRLYQIPGALDEGERTC